MRKVSDKLIAYPLTLVRFLSRLIGTMGSTGTNASYTTKANIPARPRMMGTRALAEDQGNRTPPHVSPKSTEVVAATMIAFPLNGL